MTTSPCIVCGQAVAPSLFVGCRDLYLGTPGAVDYGPCPDCGLVQQVPVPADPGLLYPESYPMHHARGRLFFLARRLLIRRVYYQPGPGDDGRVLMDFGCGDGSYLESLQGKVGRRLGFEPSPGQAESIRRHLGCETFSALDSAGAALEGSVDVITAHFVLEHVADLHATFRFWQRILKPGGRLHLAVPNLRSREARLFGRKWHGLDPPRHLSFPGRESLERLAVAHGFEFVASGSGIFPNTWAASIATVLAGRYRHPLFLALIPLGFVLACLLPQGTSVFTLRKRG